MGRTPLILFFAFLCSACGGGDRFDVDLSKVEEPELELKRLDEAVFEGPQEAERHHDSLKEVFGSFYRLYYERMLRQGGVDEPMAHVRLQSFIEDPNMKDVYQGVQEVYPELREEKERLERGFHHYKYHFPDSTLPDEWIPYQGGFSYAIYPTDTAIGVGLEFFLGREHRVTKRLPPEQFPTYKRKRMDPRYLVSEILKGWVKYKEQDQAQRAETALDHMIFEGKVLYSMDALMPHTPDSVKIKYSDTQMAWVREFEGRVWKEFVDRELFFEKDEKMIRKLVDGAPFTSVLPRESPGRAGQWLGWRMVRSFMEERPEMSLERLWAIEDAQRIFEAYKPPKS